MQSETDFMGQEDELNAAVEAYKYWMRVDPDMRQVAGDIEEEDCPVVGRKIRKRSARVAMLRGMTDLTDTTVYLDPFPHIRLSKAKDLQGWYSGKTDGQNSRNERDRPCETDAILTQPYGGYCPVGCTFCYVNSGSRGWRGSGLITVPMNYGGHVHKQLRSMHVSAAGYFSSFTDPFMGLEEWYHNTQHGATEFVKAGLPIFFLSRLHYPGWAIDLLKQSPYSYAQKSINTSNEDTWRKISPGAISLDEHFAELRELHRQGVYISIQCNPLLPGVMDDEDMYCLFERFAEVGVDHVIVKFVEANHPWAKAMVERIKQRFPGPRGDRFEELFTENSCGGQKTVQEAYRREAHTKYQRKVTSLGMTYALCYEYTYKEELKRFISMGPEFLTADQCHGHRVPMFKRIPDDIPRFEAMSVCPPSGCLRCSDTRPEGADAPCGSDLLPQAKALRLPDLRFPLRIIR